MKILLLSHKFYPFIGGIEVNSEIFANEFHKAGHKVTVMTWTKEKGNKLFPFTVIRNPTLSLLFCEHKRADVVFENNPALQLSWPQIFFRKPHVIALRTWIARSNGGLNRQDKLKLLWLKHASAVIAISEAVRKKTWLPAIVIGNPYRNDLFINKDNTNRNDDFVFFGRLVSDKGADMTIEAFAVIIKKLPYYKGSLTIIGDGAEKENLLQLASSLNLSGRVLFTGALRGEELVNELNRHQYFLVPSRWEEPFGNVALEGLACGCIPIVSNGGGLPDAVGNAGLIFERGNVADLIEKMRLILVDQVLKQTLRNNAVLHLVNHYPSVVAGRYLEVIKTVVK